MAKAIAKGISRKAYTSTTITTTKHLINEPFVLNNTFMNPFHIFTKLGDTGTPGYVDALVPIQLIGTEGGLGTNGSQEWMRHMNMYRQFRVKCIRFEYVPTNCVVGNESVLSVQGAGTQISPDDATSKIIQINTDMSSCVWLIKWPNKQGVFQDFGLNLYGTNTGTGNLKNLNMLADPSVIKVPCSEKLVLFWKPKILGRKFTMFMPTIVTTNGESAENMPKALSKAVPFPWTNIIDNYDQGHTVANSAYITGQNLSTYQGTENNTTGLYYPMSQPLIALYNTRTNEFLDDAEAQAVTNGRWRIHTVFEFRHKMGYTANIEQQPPSTLTQTVVDEFYDAKQNV